MTSKRRSTRAEALLAYVNGPDVLDVGCTGHVVRADDPEWLHGRLRDRFDRVWGIDIDPSNIQVLRDLGFDNVRVADAQDFDLEQSFDTVVAGEILEHLENPGAFLESAGRHLKSGGRIVISTPYPFSLHNSLYALYKFPKTCSNPEHTLWVCPSTLAELARRVELRLSHWELSMLVEPTTSRKYQIFLGIMRVVERVLPYRLRNNTLVAVLESN